LAHYDRPPFSGRPSLTGHLRTLLDLQPAPPCRD